MTVERVRDLVRAANPAADLELLARSLDAPSFDLIEDRLDQDTALPGVDRPRRWPFAPGGVIFAGGLALVLVWVGVMMALGDGRPAETSSLAAGSPSAPDVVFTEDRTCGSTFPALTPPGSTVFTIRNESPTPANFEVVRLETEYPAAVLMLRDLSTMGWESFRVGEFMETVGDRIQLATGQSGRVTTVLSPGTYTVLCIKLNDPVDQDMVEFIPAGPIVVGE